MFTTFEAIENLTNNSKLVFKLYNTDGSEIDRNFYITAFKWGEKFFVRHFEICSKETMTNPNIWNNLKDGRKIQYFDAIPLETKARWNETNEIDSLFND
jgi:hypothetical protein